MMQNPAKRTIAEQKWEKVSINQVYHSFLKGEFFKCIKFFKQMDINAEAFKEIIDNPDFGNEAQNCIRAMLLIERLPLLCGIPFSTVWYKVVSLNESHLNELRAIGLFGWDSDNDRNELFKVSKREKVNLLCDPSDWDTPILWGHTKAGPFTIIEGNHRFVALASLEKNIKFDLPCFIGLSTDHYPHHLPDY